MNLVRLFQVSVLLWLLAVPMWCAFVPNKTIEYQDKYLCALNKDGHWKDIRAVDQLISIDMPVAYKTSDPEFQEASLFAMQAKYLLTLDEKFEYLVRAYNKFNEIYTSTVKLNNKQKLYDFYVYRALTFIGYPYYLVTPSIKPIKQAISDLEQALELALPLNRPKEEQARLYLYLSVEYVRDHQSRLAQEAAYESLLITKDPTVYQLAYNITQTWTESLPPNYIDFDSY